MSGRAAVPELRTGVPQTDAWAQSVKQNVDWLTGQQRNAPTLKKLPPTATIEEVIEQVNAIIGRLSGS